MNASERKYKIIEQLLKVEEEEATLYQIENILNEDGGWDNIPPIIQKRIEKAIQESERGETRPHEEVMAEIKKKYNLT